MRKGLLTLVIALTVVLQTAWAYDFSATSPSGHTLYYEIISGTNVGVVRPGIGNSFNNYVSGNVVIPDTVSYNGVIYNVTELKNTSSVYGTFYGCSDLSSITIPNSCTIIGDWAFTNCSGLTSVTIPNTVTTIGIYAFSGCINLTSVVIPNSVTTIGNYAFHSCSGLTSVTIPDSVTTISNYAFYNCSNLESVDIPNSVITIGDHAFNGCSNLDSINIPNSVTTISTWAFASCKGLTSVTIPNSVTFIGSWAFSNCTGLTSITIPNSVTTIENGAFNIVKNVVYNGTATGSPWGALTVNGYIEGDFIYADSTKTILTTYIGTDTHVTIPNTVTTIGSWAFSNCSYLAFVTIPDMVTTIGDYAFYSCGNLESIFFPYSVSTIGSYAFEYCSGLTSVTISNPVTRIENGAFYSCTGLTSVTIPDSVSYIGDNAFYLVKNIVYNGMAMNSPWGALNVNGYIEGDFIYNNALKTILTAYIGTDTSVTISDSVIIIGDYAFAYRNDLASVTISNSVGSIERYAFWNCSGLTSINIPDFVATVGERAFLGCSGLTSVSFGNYVYTIEDNAFSYCTSLTSVNLGNSIVEIRDNAFSNCTSLTAITIPSSVAYIGPFAFSSCSALNTIECKSATPPSIHTSSWFNIPIDANLYVPCGSLSAYRSDNDWSAQFMNIQDTTYYRIELSENDSLKGYTEVLLNSCDSTIIKATSNEGYSFYNWSDGNTQNPRILTLNSDTSMIAYFGLNTRKITVSPVNDSMGVTIGTGIYKLDSLAMIAAIPANGYRFAYWSDSSALNPYTFRVTPTTDTHFIAYFEEIIPDTVFVHDTTIIIQIDTVINTIHDTVTNTVFDTITNTVYDTIDNFIYDTVYVTETDTLWLFDTIYLHDTIYIYDTIYIRDSTTGIEDVSVINAKIYSSRSRIVVEGAEGNSVMLFDMQGRLLSTKRDEYSVLEFEVPISGAYFVKIGSYKAKKVVVIK